uniref:Uncharacterized protein n=1 Tax=Acrobeloides nanus TaxID=290746 RepID=A0A914DM62_9BILA
MSESTKSTGSPGTAMARTRSATSARSDPLASGARSARKAGTMAATMSDVTVALATAPRTAVTTTIATATAIAGGGDRERARLIDRGADERDSDDRRERQHRPARQDRRRPPPVPRGPRRAAAHPHEGEPDEADDRDPESDGHPLLVDEVLVDHQVAGKAEADRFRAAELAALGGDPQGERNAHCDSGEGRGSDG